MAGTERAPADLFVVGANHRSSSVALRDKLFVPDSAAPGVLEGLRARGVESALLLSTCDRIEVQGLHPDANAAARLVADELAGRSGFDGSVLDGALYVLSGADALRQIFAVPASLDSMVVGETQVFGQVKAAHRLAQQAGMVSPSFETVLQAAYGAAKRVRSETAIGARAVTLLNAALQVVRDVHGPVDRLGAVLVGVGEMGEELAGRLLAAGLDRLLVCHPTDERAAALARRLEAQHHPFETFAAALPQADIVVTSLGDGRALISPEMVEQALIRRRHRPILLFDAAVPPDIDPAVNTVDDAYLYDIDDLEQVASAGQAHRADAASAAWRIIDDAVAAFLSDRTARDAVPAMTALRDRFEELRAEILRDHRDDAAEATRRLVNRLLHEPQSALRDLAASEDIEPSERLLRRLFRLDAPDKEDET